MHLKASRRQTGYDTLHKERVRLSRRIPNPAGCVKDSFADYLLSNPVRILNTQLSAHNVPASQSSLPIEVG